MSLQPPKRLPVLLIAALLPLVFCAFHDANAKAAESAASVPAIDNIANYADAQKRAASEKKYLLVLFSGEWVPEETQVKKDVLQDKKVLNAMAGRVIVARADAVRDTKPMQQYHIRNLPTLVLLSPAGEDLGRWAYAPEVVQLQVPKASEVAKDLSKVLTSGCSLYENTLSNTSMRDEFNLAKHFDEMGAYKPALKAYLQIYDAVSSPSPPQGYYVSAGNIASNLAGMSTIYPEARTALEARLENFKSRIVENPQDGAAAYQVILIIDFLHIRTNTAFDIYQLAQPGRAREALKWKAFAAFVQNKEYNKAVAIVSPDEAIHVINDYIDGQKSDALKFLRNATIRGPFSDNRFLNKNILSPVFEAYAGAGNEQVAREIARILMSEASVDKIVTANRDPLHRMTLTRQNAETIKTIIALLGNALVESRPNDAEEFAAKIDVPPGAVAAASQQDAGVNTEQ